MSDLGRGKEGSNDADAVDNVIFVQEGQALLRVLDQEKKNKCLTMLDKRYYLKGVVHVI